MCRLRICLPRALGNMQLTVTTLTILAVIAATTSLTVIGSSLPASVMAASPVTFMTLQLLLQATAVSLPTAEVRLPTTEEAGLVCTECVNATEDFESCVSNSTYVVSLTDCPGDSSVCFTHTALDEHGTILSLSRGCASLTPNGSGCSYDSGLNYTSCYCYCDQSNCTAITNSSYDLSQVCLSAVPVPVLTVSPEPTPTANAPSVQSNCTDITNSSGDGCLSAISVPPDANATENAA